MACLLHHEANERCPGDDRLKRDSGNQQAEREHGHGERRRRVDHPLHDERPRRRGNHRSTEPAHDAGDGSHLAVLDVDGAHEAEEYKRGQDEETAGCERTPNPVHRVADAGAKLCASGSGSAMQKLSAWRKRRSGSNAASRRVSSCMIAICPAGPPKLTIPSFSQNRSACPSVGSATAASGWLRDTPLRPQRRSLLVA